MSIIVDAEWWIHEIYYSPYYCICLNISIVKETLKQWGGNHLGLNIYGTIPLWWSKISTILRLKAEKLKTYIIANITSLELKE